MSRAFHYTEITGNANGSLRYSLIPLKLGGLGLVEILPWNTSCTKKMQFTRMYHVQNFCLKILFYIGLHS